MPIAKRITVAAAMLVPASVFAQGWIEFLDRDRFFGVNLPGEPEVADIQYTSAHDAVFPARVYTVEDGDKFYSVTIVDYTDAQRVHAERADRTEASRNEWIKDVRASVAHEGHGTSASEAARLPTMRGRTSNASRAIRFR